MELRIREFQLIEINQTVMRRYCNQKRIQEFNHRKEEHTDYLKLRHLKDGSLKDVKSVEKKLQTHPYFLKSKTIREEVGKEAYIKEEHSERWETYKNTNRVNLSKFLKDMLPYVDKATIKRLKHGKYFRKIVSGMLKNNSLLELANTPNAYAVLNPERKDEFFTKDIVYDLGKKFGKQKLVDMTKDEDLVEDLLEEYDLPDSTSSDKSTLRGQGSSRNLRTQLYYQKVM
ncbi:MAG: hypothetical protein KGY76_00225 [Candidatus Thermoplasmatota archaeon]|nr:hypothetical protein [Candidatus Thermoplasmatota archaeon]